MHFSIPSTEDIVDNNGSTYTIYNIQINGAYHCSVRYSELFILKENLKKEFETFELPTFPPKKMFTLSKIQIEARRHALEIFIQNVSQIPEIVNSDTFKKFLLQAQQNQFQDENIDVTVEVYLLNGQSFLLQCTSAMQTEQVLILCGEEMELPEEFLPYFGLYLVKCNGNDLKIVRPLQEFESPHLSLKNAKIKEPHKLIFRKSFWDTVFEDELSENRIALNLLYIEAVYGIEQKWTEYNDEILEQLNDLKRKKSKKEYLRLARTLQFYGCIKLHDVLIDYPNENCKAIVFIGNKELIFKIRTKPEEIKDASFKITRIRCWRITTSVSKKSDKENLDTELAFEYLIAKNTLKWINVTSEQAILISMFLQSMVDELLKKRDGFSLKKTYDKKKLSNISGTLNVQTKKKSPDSDSNIESFPAINSIFTNNSNSTRTNNLATNSAFENIGDDDL